MTRTEKNEISRKYADQHPIKIGDPVRLLVSGTPLKIEGTLLKCETATCLIQHETVDGNKENIYYYIGSGERCPGQVRAPGLARLVISPVERHRLSHLASLQLPRFLGGTR